MKTVDQIPGLQQILDDCKDKVELLIGEKVSIHYKLRFHHLTSESLVQIICDVCEVKWDDLLSESRKAHLVIARHLYCFFARKNQRKSYPVIAKHLDRDHTTVLHSVRHVENMITTSDLLYMPLITEIENRIAEATAI